MLKLKENILTAQAKALSEKDQEAGRLYNEFKSYVMDDTKHIVDYARDHPKATSKNLLFCSKWNDYLAGFVDKFNEEKLIDIELRCDINSFREPQARFDWSNGQLALE